jgi:hypothetical protein
MATRRKIARKIPPKKTADFMHLCIEKWGKMRYNESSKF